MGDGAKIHEELIKNKFANKEVVFAEKNSQSAINTGKLGYKKFLESNLKNADTILPIYLRKSQAERMKK